MPLGVGLHDAMPISARLHHGTSASRHLRVQIGMLQKRDPGPLGQDQSSKQEHSEPALKNPPLRTRH
jgi:hypothetical protein